MTLSVTRLRLAGIGGGLGAAAGVLAFGSTTTQLLMASAAGFLIGAAIGFFLATRIKDGPAAARTDRLLKADVVARILIAWALVVLGIAGLMLRGWDVKIALATLGFLIVALLCTFHRGMRGGSDFERYRR
jgi:hypothetical protein